MGFPGGNSMPLKSTVPPKGEPFTNRLVKMIYVSYPVHLVA